MPGDEVRLNELAQKLKIHILTTDTFIRAQTELRNVSFGTHILDGEHHNEQKEAYVNKPGAGSVVAFGNGKNDRMMLKAAKNGIAVAEGEGCVVDAITAAVIHVGSAPDGLDLLLNPRRCKATLWFYVAMTDREGGRFVVTD